MHEKGTLIRGAFFVWSLSHHLMFEMNGHSVHPKSSSMVPVDTLW